MRTRGGNKKFRALRLDTGNFSWGSEGNALGILKIVLLLSVRKCAAREEFNTLPSFG